MSLPYIGSLISLTTSTGVRYVGTLYTIDTAENNVALQWVRCFGTDESRPLAPGQEFVPATNDVYDFIIFKGPEIAALTVMSGQQQPPPQPQVQHPQPQPAVEDPYAGYYGYGSYTGYEGYGTGYGGYGGYSGGYGGGNGYGAYGALMPQEQQPPRQPEPQPAPLAVEQPRAQPQPQQPQPQPQPAAQPSTAPVAVVAPAAATPQQRQPATTGQRPHPHAEPHVTAPAVAEPKKAPATPTTAAPAVTSAAAVGAAVPAGAPRRGQVGSGAFLSRGRQNGGSGVLQGDFDFEAANAKFGKDISDVADQTDDVQRLRDQLKQTGPAYDKKSSFFDNLGPARDDDERLPMSQQRQKDKETFGATHVERPRGPRRGGAPTRGGRGASAGRGGRGGGGGGARGGATTGATGGATGSKPCNFWAKGHCKFGDDCKFSHSS